MKVNVKGLKNFRSDLNKMQNNLPKLMFEVATEIGNEFLQDVIKRTPKSDTDELKDGWKLEVKEVKNVYEIKIYNNVGYASKIEYGYSDFNGTYKDGYYMMTITQDEIVNRKMETIAHKKLLEL